MPTDVHSRCSQATGLAATIACIVAAMAALTACGDDDDGGESRVTTHKALSGAAAAKLENAAAKAFRASGTPGAVVAVATPDGRFEKAFGVADTRTKAPMTTDVHHRVGSVTKTFTGTLLMQLVGEGKVDLDAPISKYIAGVPRGDEISVRQVANMTSGIASYTMSKEYVDAFLAAPEKVWTPDEVLRIGLAQPPSFKPGTAFEYSNTNTVLIGKVVEKLTGKPIGEVMSERVIEPLGLTGTSWPGDSAALPKPHARGYTLQGQPEGKPADATSWSTTSAWTAGEIISTADDLLVYGRALATGKGLLSPKLQKERLASFNPDIPPLTKERSYGITLVNNGGWIGHTGSIPGFNTAVYHHPELDTTSVVEANSDEHAADVIQAAIAESLGRTYYLPES